MKITKFKGTFLSCSLSVLLVLTVLVQGISVSAVGQLPELVSKSTIGSESDLGAGINDFWGAQISDNGRYVAYLSKSTNLGAYRDGYPGVYVYDRIAQTTTLASVNSSGVQENGYVYRFDLSGDGRHLGFVTSASNLDPNSTASGDSVYVRDLDTGVTQIASLDNRGQPIYGGQYFTISDDGNVVAFSKSTNPGQLFVRNMSNQTTRQLPNGTVPRISGNGTKVVYRSSDDQAAVYDLVSGASTVASVSPSGALGNAETYYMDISDDGNYVAFLSNASNILPGSPTTCSPNQCSRIYRRNLASGSTERVDVTSMEEDFISSTTVGGVEAPIISGDGSKVGFNYTKQDPVTGKFSGQQAVRDFALGQTYTISNNESGIPTNGGTNWSFPSLNYDGSLAALVTQGSNFGVVSNRPQVFVVSAKSTDNIKPTVTGAAFTQNPLLQSQNTTLSVKAIDAETGISKVEYRIDGGTQYSMSYDPVSDSWTDVFGANLTVNTYNIEITAIDNAGNISDPLSDILAVYNSTNGYVTGHIKTLPSSMDVLPIALDTNQSQGAAKLVIGFTNIKAATSLAPTAGSFDVSYVVKNNKDAFSFSSTVIDWLVVPDSSHASILGHADLTTYVNGAQTVLTNVSARFDVTLGANGGPDHVTIKIYQPGVNPNTGTPSWTINDDALINQSNVMIKP